MKIKKSLALLTALALALSLTSCGIVPFQISDRLPEDGDGPSPGVTTQESFYQQAWHGDVAFEDMEYEHYDPEQLTEYTDPIYRMAESGGTEDEFIEADNALFGELYYIYTLYSIMDLRSNADVNDEYAASESLYTSQVYYDALGAYYAAMHALAVSPNSSLLESAYDQSIIDIFISYDPSDDGGREEFGRENELVNQYYSLIAQPEPDFEAIAQIYVELVELRRQEARSAGYSDYASYAYENIYYKDYSPQDSQAIWQGVKEYIVPVVLDHAYDVELQAGILTSSELDCSVGAVIGALETVLPQIHPDLAAALDYMLDYGLYDIGISGSKVDTGFTTLLYYYNEPFIFNASSGTYRDYTDMFHEFGHFANYFYTESSLLFGMSDFDLSELQSQGLEVLASFFYQDLFGAEAGEAMADSVIQNMAISILDGAMYDEFQQLVYSEEDLTAQRVTEIFTELYSQYGYAPYEGYEHEWMYVSHNFDYPFYYISYSVSAAAALELLTLAQSDWDAAVERYLAISAMDTESYYYSQALQEAGFSDIFDPEAYVSLAATLEAILQ